MNKNNQVGNSISQIYEKRFDFYWKSIAIYSIVLIIYSLLRGTIEQGKLTMAIFDPIVIFLAIVIAFSVIGYLFNLWKSPKILISKELIVFKSRFYEKKLPINEIIRISIGREKLYNLKHQLKVIKIYTIKRKKPYRIHPSSFWNEKELTQAILSFKKANKK
ncbi:MAG: hypothetical protein ACUVQ1_05100 [Candidatus Kapaibacteriales bacterium]